VLHPDPFMPDFQDRVAATQQFFATNASPRLKRELIKKYSVCFVLVPKVCRNSVDGLAEELVLTYQTDEYNLYTVRGYD
jgi:hypothetical protein